MGTRYQKQQIAAVAEQRRKRLAIEWSVVAALLALLLLLTLFFVLAHQLAGMNRFDIAVLQWVHARHSAARTSLMAAMTNIGSVGGLALQSGLLLLLLAWRRTPAWARDAALVLLVMIGGGLLNTILKHSYQRLRPELFESAYQLHSFSFPSAHAMCSTTFYGVVAWLALRRIQRALLKTVIILLSIAAIGLISVSRLYFAVHYPTDIIGGILAGLAWLIFSVMTVRTFNRRRRLERLAERSSPDIQ